MKVPKSIRFLTKKGKDKEEKELRKWSSNPDLNNETVIDGNPKRRKSRGHTRNISSPSALASIKSRIQEVEIKKNDGKISPRPAKKSDVREKPTRPAPKRVLSVVHEDSSSRQSSPAPTASVPAIPPYNNFFILGLLFTLIGFNSAWLFEEILLQMENKMIIELWVFGAGILLLPFMKFRKRAIVFLSFGSQCFLLFLQFGKGSVLARFDDYFRK